MNKLLHQDLLVSSTHPELSQPKSMTQTMNMSRHSCCADGCVNSKFKDSKFTFHPFPKDVGIRKQWLAAMGKSAWDPPPRSLLCSAHFTEDSFQEILGLNCLKMWAVPSVFHTPGNKSLVKQYIGKPSSMRPKGILKCKGSSTSTVSVSKCLKVKSDEYLFAKEKSKKTSNQSGAFQAEVVNITEEETDDVEMIDLAPRSVRKTFKSPLKDVSEDNSFLSEYLVKRNACVQTENLIGTAQTETSVHNHDDIGDSGKLLLTVDMLRTKLESLQSYVVVLENNLMQKEKEVDLLVSERNELSSRLNKETMIVVERSFKEVLQEFLNDDHSSMEKFLTKNSQLCLNTNISFGKSSGNLLGKPV